VAFLDEATWRGKVFSGGWKTAAGGEAVVTEPATGKELLTFKGHSGLVNSAAFSPDGQQIVTGSSDQTAKVWEAATGKELLTFKGHSGGVYSAASCPAANKL